MGKRFIKPISAIVCFACILAVLFVSYTLSFAEINPFIDVDSGKWYGEAVLWAYDKGYVSGTSKNTFSPYAKISRCDFIVMLAKYDNVDKNNYTMPCEFSDVERGTYYFEYVNWAYKNGIISGTSKHRFSPAKSVTREEICVILAKYCEYAAPDIYTAKYANDFSDALTVSEWARESVDFAHRSSLICGYANTLTPKGNVTRAQAVTMLYALEKASVAEVPKETVDVSDDRQLLLENRTVDSDNTTALLEYIYPTAQDSVFNFRALYERNGTVYHNIVKAPDGKYRMYYKATDATGWRRICYIESSDGVNWTRPTTQYKFLNMNTNIVTADSYGPDNLFVFYDTNPNGTGTKWKGIYGQWGDGLFCEYSPDGLSFFNNGETQIFGDSSENGGLFFDTLNTMYYDSARGKYVAFVRGFHNGDDCTLTKSFVADNPSVSIRDIRYVESTDMVNWSEPEAINYDEEGFADSHMYANAVAPYYRCRELYVGMPTKLQYVTDDKRVTQVFLMSSRDLLNWNITKDPYLTPEDGTTYDYGTCGGFPCVGIIQTSDKEMSMYMSEYSSYYGFSLLCRYTLRIDGFRCAKATDKAILETKYLDYKGSDLEINFKTTGNGYIMVTATDINGKSVTSAKLTGDKITQGVFTNGELSELSVGAVKLSFEMSCAELYSYKFN